MLLEALGVWGEKEWDGKKFMGATRSTYLIDATGAFEKLWEDVPFEGHAQEVLEYCESK